MSAAAFILVLGAAILHASWNLVVKSAPDRLVAGWSQAAFGALVFGPVLIVQGIPTEAWRSIVASSAVHTGYALALVAAYDRGDLSAVYPVARGSAPVLITAGAALVLSDRPGPVGVIAVAFVVAGVLSIGLGGRVHGLAWAFATAGFIATYTLIDGAAVRSLDGALPYTIAVFWGNTLLLTPIVLARRRSSGLARAVRAAPLRNAFAGAASAAAYGLVLAAARLAPLGLVAAVRESSVVFGALAGWLVLGEPLGRRRVVAAVVIAGGLALAATA